MNKLKRIILFIAIILISVGLYLYLTFKYPVFEITEKFDIIELTDSTCELSIFVHIINPNFYSFTIRNFTGTLDHGVTAISEDPFIVIQGSSDVVHKINLRLNFLSFENLIKNTGKEDSTNSQLVTFECKPGVFPHFFKVTKKLDNKATGISGKLVAGLVVRNVSIDEIQIPEKIDAGKLKMKIRLKITNPYAIAFTINNYEIRMTEHLDTSGIIGNVFTKDSIRLNPRSEHFGETEIQLDPALIILSGITSLIKKKVYDFKLTGSVNINNQDYYLTQTFNYNLQNFKL